MRRRLIRKIAVCRNAYTYIIVILNVRRLYRLVRLRTLRLYDDNYIRRVYHTQCRTCAAAFFTIYTADRFFALRFLLLLIECNSKETFPSAGILLLFKLSFSVKCPKWLYTDIKLYLFTIQRTRGKYVGIYLNYK